MGKSHFLIPFLVLVSLGSYMVLRWNLNQPTLATLLLLSAISLGSWQLLVDTFRSLLKGSLALDYIAILAIGVGLATQNYVVAAVIVIMMSGGNALEAYAQALARRSLTTLKDRLPHTVQVVETNNNLASLPIEKVSVGSLILVRKGEVVPLDGILTTSQGSFDEASLTGEPYPVAKQAGDTVKSGTVNVGEAVHLKTTVVNNDSSYAQIVKLVREAEQAKAPFIQLADTLSGIFTILTLGLAGLAYFISHDFTRVLAVLVIATPCPLILATPIALIGGMNAAARQRIIFKRLAILEKLAQTTVMVFDKTGTLTLGKPRVDSLEILDAAFTRSDVLAIASGIERNSLHPYAKAVLAEAMRQQIQPAHCTHIAEKIGQGIQGQWQGKLFQLAGSSHHSNSQVTLSKNGTPIAIFNFREELKQFSREVIDIIQKLGLRLIILTGDSATRSQTILQQLPHHNRIQIFAGLSPQAKQQHLIQIKRRGEIVAMVGDGINDAPALALADIGLVFSHQEHTAASEAADVVLLGGDFRAVLEALKISRRTMNIAKQSMYVGVSLSLLGMLAATAGYLPPLAGAITQELIDVAVILNALRSVL